MKWQEQVALEQAVIEALRIVLDPELGVNIVDLGMIYGVIASEDGLVDILMTTTTRGCPAAGFLTQAVQACAEGVAGVEKANVELTYEPEWQPEMASAEAQARFAAPLF